MTHLHTWHDNTLLSTRHHAISPSSSLSLPYYCRTFGIKKKEAKKKKRRKKRTYWGFSLVSESFVGYLVTDQTNHHPRPLLFTFNSLFYLWERKKEQLILYEVKKSNLGFLKEPVSVVSEWEFIFSLFGMFASFCSACLQKRNRFPYLRINVKRRMPRLVKNTTDGIYMLWIR